MQMGPRLHQRSSFGPTERGRAWSWWRLDVRGLEQPADPLATSN